jgi:hypothetical protein
MHYASFTTGSDKTTVRNSFVAVSQVERPTLDIDKDSAADVDPQDDGEIGGSHTSQSLVSVF